MVRYVDEMKAEGVPIFALTLQNEPHFEPGDYPGMRMPPATCAPPSWAGIWARCSRPGA
jgi:glucosylceramidase